MTRKRLVCAGAAVGAGMLSGIGLVQAIAALTSPIDLLTQANIQLNGAVGGDGGAFEKTELELR